MQFSPNHMQPRFAVAGVKLPTTEALFREIVTLPLFAEITPQQVAEVIDTVVSF
ncbi:MAG: DegT/DnrJ/EryC1/StrS family aminotransferase [Cyanobium sp.]